jgi:hypothetical protein
MFGCQQKYVRVAAKVTGLRKHILERQPNWAPSNENLLCECEEQMRGERWLKARGIECLDNAVSEAWSQNDTGPSNDTVGYR